MSRLQVQKKQMDIDRRSLVNMKTRLLDNTDMLTQAASGEGK